MNQPAWLSHVHSVAEAMPGLVPVVKGNGYGFRRWNLMTLAGQVSDEIAVGSIFEVKDIPKSVTPIVLTPTLVAPPSTLPANTVLTVGSPHHVMALTTAGWKGSVMVKLQSSMRRFGVSRAHLSSLLADLSNAGYPVHGFAVHPPLEGDDKAHLADIVPWLDHLPKDATLYVSHLSAEAYGHLCASFPDRKFRIRLGTALWHGNKSTLQLSADVLGYHSIEIGQRAGYRQIQVTGPGEIVLVGCGSAHGVAPLSDGRSPFHFQKQRLNMLEPPHMHTTMLLVARGRRLPGVGEWIDVQQPLTQVQVDILQWVK